MDTTTDTVSHDAVMDAIRGGALDDKIREIAHAAKHRVKVVEARTASSFKVGDRVKIAAANIKPKYLFGMTGTVTSAKAGRAPRLAVQLDEQYREKAARFTDYDGTIEGAPTLFGPIG